MGQSQKKVVQLSGLVLFILLLSGCAITPDFNFPTGPKNEPRPQYFKSERIITKPQILKTVTPQGEVITQEIAYSSDQVFEVRATPPKQARPGFVSFILSQWWFWLVLAIIVFVPGGWSLFAFGANRVRNRMGQVVRGVENYLRTEASQDSKNSLLKEISGASDSKTKDEVSKLKRKM